MDKFDQCYVYIYIYQKPYKNERILTILNKTVHVNDRITCHLNNVKEKYYVKWC